MILLHPSFRLEYEPDYRDLLHRLEAAGRTCYKSAPKKSGPEAFVRGLLRKGHASVIEHVGFTFRLVVDRGVSHELVRARLASYSQESTRYVDYSGKKTGGHCQFILPLWLPEIPEGEVFYLQIDDDDPEILHVGGRTHPIPAIEVASPMGYRWLLAMAGAERDYKAFRSNGWSAEQARVVLPHSTKTEVVMTANAREWRTILRARTAKDCHPQMLEVMRPLLSCLKGRYPALFDDIEVAE